MAMSYIKLYYDFRKTLKSMPDEAAGRLIKAIFDYVVDGYEPELQNGEQYVFLMLQSQLDRDKEAYEKTVARNQENGRNGGRPKKTEKTQENPVGFSETQENPDEPTKSQDKNKIREDKNKTKTKNKEKDKDNIIEIENPFAYVDDSRPDFNTLEVYITNNLQHMSGDNLQELISYRDILGDDLVRHAINKATGRGTSFSTFSYVKGILQNYIKDGIKTITDAKAAEEKFRQSKEGERNGSRTNQRRNADNRGSTDEQPKPACPWDIIL